MNITTVLYDGECQFCKKWVHFAQSKLQDKKISFIAFNSVECIKIEQELKIGNQDSVVYIQNNIVFIKSQAVLKICKQLQSPYNYLVFLKILPAFLLNLGYDFIAKRRHKLTNKKTCCNEK
jgi:predicted DCC family thiol-disulfide oxidoreductase YuxK